MDQTAQNRQQQTELYGEPLGDLIRRVGYTLGLTQAKLAEVVGLSAPMLSQLISAQRVKIGNPAVVTRLHALDEFAQRAAAESLDPAEIAAGLTEIRATTGAFTRAAPATTSGPRPGGRVVVREIQDLLRSVASATEIQQVAEKIVADYPDLAEFLTTYGAGRTDDALAHYERHHG
ncbi:hypothetical protein FB561_6445 [Kribbella amoyensis]|uniref:Helix-turn-helix protein n=1 Tax=Kribbella amoyensis TaxID=996641 RepID=A0A561B840_9ACTN|nr:DNA-binding protein [Kribbella amoyensis]TWD75010.1 hypothetical protein FB561_6445 [Kribbella amoyensis]